MQTVVLADKQAAPNSPTPTGSTITFPARRMRPRHGNAFTENVGLTAANAVERCQATVDYADINPGDRSDRQDAVSIRSPIKNAQQPTSGDVDGRADRGDPAVEVPLVVVQDPANNNHGSATWTYSVADGAFDFLAAGETLTLTYIAQVDNNYAPNNETTFKSFTITITGTNDAPIDRHSVGHRHRAGRDGNTDARHGDRNDHLHRRRFDRPSGRQRLVLVRSEP